MPEKQNTIVVCPFCKTKCDGWDLIEESTGDRFCNDGAFLEGVCPNCKKDFYIECNVSFDFKAVKE